MTTNATSVCEIVDRQRVFFRTGVTRDIGFRARQLKALLHAVEHNEPAILEALKADLNKSRFEAYRKPLSAL